MADDDAGLSRAGRVRRKSSKLRQDDSSPLGSAASSSFSSPTHLPPAQLLASETEEESVDIGDDNEMNNVDWETNDVKTAARDGKLTAYMLWAKQERPILMKQQPNLDYSSVRRRLGEMWGRLSSQEKSNWKRKARKLTAANANIDNSVGGINDSGLSSVGGQNLSAMSVDGAGPIELAAHLALLGESLSVIGGRLTDHEGQIAVSGSLSVLLDSLLCAMGPLLCLTSTVPELAGAEPEVLHNILDNVAYIMPGL